MQITTNIGWVGLGKLGLPMAARLVRAGHNVHGFDPDKDRVALGRKHGIGLAENHCAVARAAEIVFTSLPDDHALEHVLLGPGGLIASLSAGAMLAETSTVSPRASARVAEAAATAGIAYLRLPMSGSTTLAEAGQLTCFASGPQDAFERVRPMLAALTKAQSYLGEQEQARYAKLAINLMISVSAGMMAESLALARKGGIGWRDFLELMGESAVASPFVKYKTGQLAERDFAPMFTARQIIKDMDLILGAADEMKVPTPLTSVLRASYAEVLAAGEGDDDFITIVRHVERLAGLGEPV